MNKPIEPSSVIVRGRAEGFAQEIVVGKHRLVSDEPMSMGGTDSGPSPYDLILAALGACTSMTIALYARHKQWPLDSVTVHLRHSKSHAVDCAQCENNSAMLDRVDCDIELAGALTSEQHEKILEIANKCPVHRTLTSKIDINTRLI